VSKSKILTEYLNQQRHYPSKSIEEYIKNPLAFEIEEIDLQDVKTEKILLGLRCSNGVEISLFDDLELKKIDELIEYDKVYIENNRLYNKNFLLSDELALYILD
jgi:oxygen-independent coproporphyrinogen-3 oxidase